MKKLLLLSAVFMCFGLTLKAQVMPGNESSASYPGYGIFQSDIGSNRAVTGALPKNGNYGNETVFDKNNNAPQNIPETPGSGTQLMEEMSGSYSNQAWWTRSYFPSTEISDGWSSGRAITELAYGDGLWGLVMSGGTGYTSQAWWTRSYFPSTEISDGWNSGKLITELTYGNGVWALVMSSGTGYSTQAWWTTSYFPSTEISDGWNSGKNITSLSYGDGIWALVMSGSTGYSSQAWWTRSYFPSTEISDGWNSGKKITDIAYGNGTWSLVMSGGTGYNAQAWWTRSNFPSTEISDGWNSGKFISHLTYGDGLWALVMSKSTVGVDELTNNSISIYPNPASDVLNIKGLTGKSEVMFYSLKGELIRQQSVDGSEINISDLSQGVYLLRILSNGKILTTQRIVKL